MIKNVKARISSLPHIPSNDWVVLHWSAYGRNTTCCTGPLMETRVDRKLQDLTAQGGGWSVSGKRTKTVTYGKGGQDPPHSFPGFIVQNHVLRTAHNIAGKGSRTGMFLGLLRGAVRSTLSQRHIWSELVLLPIASLTTLLLSIPLSKRNTRLSLLWLK